MLSAQRFPAGSPGAQTYDSGIGLFGAAEDTPSLLWGLISAASAGVSAYHGYKRNNGSIGWAVGWGILGGIFPVITPAIAFAQGIGKKK